jgi:hypothetical protein
MTKQLVTDDFGADWPRQKLLCYDVRCYVINTLGYLEMLQETKLNQSDSEKALQGAFRQTKAAVDAVEELFKVICEKEREGTLLNVCQRPSMNDS